MIYPVPALEWNPGLPSPFIQIKSLLHTSMVVETEVTKTYKTELNGSSLVA